MAHYALLNSANVVTQVITGKDETDTLHNWEDYYGNFHNCNVKRTSYNTKENTHILGDTPFRGNYAGIAGGGLQTPGVMGVGKFYIISPKFISADGGLQRVVWMSKNLKDSMEFELRAAAERDGVPDFLDKIADGTNVTTVEELETWVKEKNHPVLDMEPMEAKAKEAAPADEPDVIAQAEAVVEKAIAKEEAHPETELQVEEPIVQETPPPPPAPVSTTPPPTGSVEERVERLERAVTTLIGSLVGSRSATLALPLLGSVRPNNINSVVVFPAPFGPRKPKISPSFTLKER